MKKLASSDQLNPSPRGFNEDHEDKDVVEVAPTLNIILKSKDLG